MQTAAEERIQNQKPLTIRVDLEKDKGWYTATSRDLPSLFLAGQNRDEIIDDLPNAVGLLYSELHRCKCRVVPSEYPEQARAENVPLIVVPEWLKDRFSGSESFAPAPA